LGRRGTGAEAIAPSPCREFRDADPGDAWRARLPGTVLSGPGLLQHAPREACALAPGVLPRREPLDLEAAEFSAVVPRVPWLVRSPYSAQEVEAEVRPLSHDLPIAAPLASMDESGRPASLGGDFGWGYEALHI